MTAFRVLVTGSRDWTERRTVYAALDDLLAEHATVTVVHGACPRGVDSTASHWCRRGGFRGAEDRITEEQHPAAWVEHGRHAGMQRNAEMVGAGADRCLAFIRNHSRGASHCARLAEAAGIPTTRWTA